MVYFKENYNFPRLQRGFQHISVEPIFSGGGGVQLLIPIETIEHVIFQGRGVWTLSPSPLDTRINYIGRDVLCTIRITG